MSTLTLLKQPLQIKKRPQRCSPFELDEELEEIFKRTDHCRFSLSQPSTPRPATPRITIRTVWAHNLEHELKLINEIIGSHPFVAFDSEFPRKTEICPKHYRKRTPEDRYEELKFNVYDHNLTQLGLTLSDADGGLPYGGYVWEFNFGIFDKRQYRRDPLLKLKLRYQGVFCDPCGIDYTRFAELFRSSGLFGSDTGLRWVTFSGSYDIGFLTKILSGRRALPETIEDFVKLIREYLGTVFDSKHLMSIQGFDDRMGLNALAGELGVTRAAGSEHTAGSDSLVTMMVFLKLKNLGKDGWEGEHNFVFSGLQVI